MIAHLASCQMRALAQIPFDRTSKRLQQCPSPTLGVHLTVLRSRKSTSDPAATDTAGCHQQHMQPDSEQTERAGQISGVCGRQAAQLGHRA